MARIASFALVATASCAAAFSASAATLDFTDINTFNPLTSTSAGASGVTVDGLNWTVTPSSAPMRYNFPDSEGAVFGGWNQGFDGGIPDGSDAPENTGLALYGDGLGIGRTDDEVSDPEVGTTAGTMSLTFTQKVKITGLHFLDLFTSDIGTEAVEVFDIISGLSLGTFFAVADLETDEDGGYLFASFNYEGYGIRFETAGTRDDRSIDFALAGVEVAPIPVPAAGLLLLTGLGGLAIARRRKSA